MKKTGIRKMEALLLAVMILLAVLVPGMCAAEDNAAGWAGERTLESDPDSWLMLTDDGDGCLYMLAVFAGMGSVETIIAPENGFADFADEAGLLEGFLTLDGNGSITMTVTGGIDLEENEAFADYFLGRDLVFSGRAPQEQDQTQLKGRYTQAAPDGEMFRITDEYNIGPGGRIYGRTHYEYTDGRLKTRTEYGKPDEYYRYHYDEAGNMILMENYIGGTLQTSEGYTFDETGKKIRKDLIGYSGTKEEVHYYEYYDYDPAGRQVQTRYAKDTGEEMIKELYEYEADGSCTRYSYSTFTSISGELTDVTMFDSQGREIRNTSYADGEVYYEIVREYEQKEKGKLLRLKIIYPEQEIVTNYERDGNGKELRRITADSTGAYGGTEIVEHTYNEQGKETRYVTTTITESTVITDMIETEYDSSGLWRLAECTTTTDADGYRKHGGYTYYLYEGDRGTLLGIDPMPEGSDRESGELVPADMSYFLHSLTLDDVVNSYGGRKICSWIYDSDMVYRIDGFAGRLRFVFWDSSADRIQTVLWVCDDEYADSDEIFAVVGDDISWDRTPAWLRMDAVGIDELGGSFNDDNVLFIDGMGTDVIPLLMVAFSIE